MEQLWFRNKNTKLVLLTICLVFIFVKLHEKNSYMQQTMTSEIGQNGLTVTRKDTRNMIGQRSCDPKERSEKVRDTYDKRIQIAGDHCLEYNLNGTLFGEKGLSKISHKVRMCHLKTFEDSIARDAEGSFINIHENISFFLNSPSLLWFNNELIVTLRLRLKMDGTNGRCLGYSCNYMTLGHFDKFLNPVGRQEIVSLQLPLINNRAYTGPHDARLFQMNNSLFTLFATGYNTSLISTVWDFQKRRHFIPDFQRALLKTRPTVLEKNWVPLIIKEELYIIRYLDPLQVLKCKVHDGCEFVKNNTDALKYEINDENTPLRGGTNFELYKYPYYIGIAHGTYKKDIYRIYEAYLVILCVNPFKIVYVSDNFKIHPDVFSRKAIWKALIQHFIFPISLVIENDNSIVIGAHANDAMSVILRLEGIQPIAEAVIQADQKSNFQNEDFSIQRHLLERARTFTWTDYRNNKTVISEAQHPPST